MFTLAGCIATRVGRHSGTCLSLLSYPPLFRQPSSYFTSLLSYGKLYWSCAWQLIRKRQNQRTYLSVVMVRVVSIDVFFSLSYLCIFASCRFQLAGRARVQGVHKTSKGVSASRYPWVWSGEEDIFHRAGYKVQKTKENAARKNCPNRRHRSSTHVMLNVSYLPPNRPPHTWNNPFAISLPSFLSCFSESVLTFSLSALCTAHFTIC